MITPIRKSNIFHEIEFWNRGSRNFAPYPKEKKNIHEDRIAPIANVCNSSVKFVEIEPTSTTVSK